jgi:hypothetical protein
VAIVGENISADASGIERKAQVFTGSCTLFAQPGMRVPFQDNFEASFLPPYRIFGACAIPA